ncbi:MAG: ABC transporter permease [Acidobacteria bacterium]|nr:ABC transporter permease [Acidobacteriota bacterium]
MTGELILSNIRKRRTRTLVSILAVCLGVGMVILFVGLSKGILNDTAFRTRSIKADLLFQPTGSSLFMALNNATMPVRIGEKLRQVPGVKYVTPCLHQFSKASFSLIYGIEPVSFNQVSDDGLRIVQGRIFSAPYECIVDDMWLLSHPEKRIGSTVEVLNHHFTISGVFKAGIAARILLPLQTLQELNDSVGKVSIFYVKCDGPAGLDRAHRFLTTDDLFKSYNITRAEDIEKVMASSLPGLREFTLVVVGVACLISFLVVLLTMYTTITERTREIGILKALGASRGYIIQLIMKESILLTVIGIVCGIGFSIGATLLLWKIYPTLSIELNAQWIAIASFIAMASGAVGSLYPAYRAARLDPVEALMYE